MNLWRIATETRRYSADDLSGGGAAAHPGRWNDDGQSVVYAAPSIALAVLETAAHVDDSGLPLNRFLVRLDIPDEVWRAREELHLDELPPGWASVPAGRTSVRIGSEWLRAQRTAILVAPSAIVPEERIALLNPGHAGARAVTATVVRPFQYDRLFRSR